MMLWVATEDSGTAEITDFVKTTEKEVLYLMDGYKVSMQDAEKFRVTDVEDGLHVIYEGLIYKGGYGYNLWVASKYAKM